MNLFDLLNPKMFRPLTGGNQRIYADLLMLIWDRCGTSQDYSIEKNALTELAETYIEGLGSALLLEEEGEYSEPLSDARSQALLFIRRLRDAGWLEELESGYEEETRIAICAPAVSLLRLFDELLHPKTVTYSGKLSKAYRLLQGLSEEKSPYENVIKEVSADMADLNTSLRQLNASIGGYIDQLTRNRTPQEVLETLSDLTNDDAIICTDVGQHQMWAAQFYRFRHPRQFISSGGLGTMGFGLGAALGAQVANPDARVINIAGDGSFHMNCNELATAVAYNIPVMELVFNNSVLGMVRQWQKLFYDNRFSQTDLDKNTDFVKLAEAFGAKAFVIQTKADIRPVLEQALALREPVLIDCRIDKDVNVLPMVPAGASVESPILEM